MSADDFQTKYASVMESMLRSAVAETTKLFETMVDELKAEISKIKEENEDLKTRCSQFEKNQTAVYTRESNRPPERSSGKRDTAVQCDLVPFRTVLVEQVQPLTHLSLQNQEQQYAYEGMEYSLQEHNYFSHAEGDSHMAFVLVKQEEEDSSSPLSDLKEEDVESPVIRGQFLCDNAGSSPASVSRTENEGPPIVQEPSAEEMGSSLQGDQDHPSEPEPLLVFSLAAIKDDNEDESEVFQSIPETGTQGELATSEKHQLVSQQCERDRETLVNEQTEQYRDVHCTEGHLAESTLINKDVACEELKTGVTQSEDSSKTKSVRRRRGRPPKKNKCKEVLQSSSADVPGEQEGLSSSGKGEFTVSISSSTSAQASPVQPEETSAIVTPSVQDRESAALEDVENREVGSLPVSSEPWNSCCSSENQATPESQQLSVEGEEEAVQPPNAEVSSPSETLNSPPAESPQTSDQVKERRTSVTLQDAMLLVEAMNQSTVDPVLPDVGTLQTVDEIPAEPETPDPVETQLRGDALGVTPDNTGATSTDKAQAHNAIVILKQKDACTPFSSTTVTLTSAAVVQASVVSLPCPLTLTPSVTLCKLTKTVPRTIIVAPKSGSHKTAAVPPNQLSTMSAASQNSSLPLGTSPHSSGPQKTIKVVYRKSFPLVSQSVTTSTDQQLQTPPPKRITVVIPRLPSAVASREQQPQTTAPTAQQEAAKPAAPVEGSLISTSQELSVFASDDTILTQKKDSTTDNPESPKEPVSVSEPAAPVEESLTQLISTSQELAVSASDDTVLSQKEDNTTDNPESSKEPVSVSETINVPAETCSSSEESVEPVPPPTVKEKRHVVVRLTRLPFPVSPEESVSVSWLLSEGHCEGTTQEKPKPKISLLEMPVVSWNTAVSGNTSQMSEEPNNLREGSISSTTKPSVVPAVGGGPNLDKELINNEVQEKKSAALMQLTSMPKGICDPYVQMSKTQFLPHLSVSPTVQAPKKSSTNDTETSARDKKNAQENSLVTRLRNHLKTHLQMRRSATKRELHTQSETTSVSMRKRRLQNDSPQKNTTREPISTSPKKTDVVEDNTSLYKVIDTPSPISSRRSGLRKDSVRPKSSERQPVSSSSTRSKAASDSTPASPSSDRDGKGFTNNESVSPNRSHSIKESASPGSNKSTSVSPRRASSAKESASLQNTKSQTTSKSPKRLAREGASPKRTESTSVSPGTSSLSKNGSSPKMSGSCRTTTFPKDGSSPKQIKRESFSRGRYSMITDSASTKTSNSDSASPNVKCPKMGKNGISPTRTSESTPGKKPRLIQDGAGPKRGLQVINAMKLARAARAKRIATMINTKKSESQSSHSAECQANCGGVKKCITKGVWFPPTLPDGEVPLTGGKDSLTSPLKAETKSPNKSLNHTPIPFRATPIVSPLQPLAMIGKFLLRNQCGECGRVFSSSAALESHVSLHTGRRPLSCTLCGKRFPDIKGLKRHDRVHRNGRIHICQQCGKGFVYKFTLTKHIQMVHSRIKPFICQICNKGYYTKRDVETHILSHTGEKPFSCHLCERKFDRKVKLNVHLRWHNGEKRYWCPYCGKGFLEYNNLKRHRYIHTGEKPYSCPHCPKNFTQTGHLKKHVKNVHKIK